MVRVAQPGRAPKSISTKFVLRECKLGLHSLQRRRLWVQIPPLTLNSSCLARTTKSWYTRKQRNHSGAASDGTSGSAPCGSRAGTTSCAAAVPLNGRTEYEESIGIARPGVARFCTVPRLVRASVGEMVPRRSGNLDSDLRSLFACLGYIRAVNSTAECLLHTQEVAGSTPAPPTGSNARRDYILHHVRGNWLRPVNVISSLFVEPNGPIV